VFRTPLGAALLAAEILYRDDFEAEALIPAVLASVIAYSVVITIFGESTLFARSTISLHPQAPALGRLRVSELLRVRTPIRTFRLATALPEMHRALGETTWQTTFPVVDTANKILGVVSAASIGLIAPRDGVPAPAVASDLMQPPTLLGSRSRPSRGLTRGRALELAMRGVHWKGSDVQVTLREGRLYLLGTKSPLDVESEVGRNAAVLPGIRDPDEEREVEAGATFRGAPAPGAVPGPPSRKTGRCRARSPRRREGHPA
jgi:hypothetical protein